MPIITSGTSDPRSQSPLRTRSSRPAPETASGPALLIGEPDEPEVLPIPIGWSRIGRSHSAEIRVEDPGVSRRHALIVRSREGRLQIIDDRSLTGIYVNGHAVSWSRLCDGDELTLGGVRMLVRNGGGVAQSN